MPIKAAADKLNRELIDYGNPPDFDKNINAVENSVEMENQAIDNP